MVVEVFFLKECILKTGLLIKKEYRNIFNCSNTKKGVYSKESSNRNSPSYNVSIDSTNEK